MGSLERFGSFFGVILIAWCIYIALENIESAAFVPKSEFPVFTSISDLMVKAVPYQADRLVEGQVEGPETVIPLGKNELVTFTKTGSVFRVTNGKATEIVNLGNKTRPLGASFAKNGDLYIADAVRGLLKVSEKDVEVVASSVGGSPILYCNDVDISTSGAVYFTDSTDIVPQPIEEGGSLLTIPLVLPYSTR